VISFKVGDRVVLKDDGELRVNEFAGRRGTVSSINEYGALVVTLDDATTFMVNPSCAMLECRCNIMAGCICGAHAREMAAKQQQGEA